MMRDLFSEGAPHLPLRPRGVGKIPWGMTSFPFLPSISQANAEQGLVSVEGYTTALQVTFNPNGNSLPANTYQLNAYAVTKIGRCLVASLVLSTATTMQSFRAKAPARAWDVTVQLLLGATIPTWGSQAPTVSAYAHGQE